MDEELGVMWKQTAIVCLQASFQRFTRIREENDENLKIVGFKSRTKFRTSRIQCNYHTILLLSYFSVVSSHSNNYNG